MYKIPYPITISRTCIYPGTIFTYLSMSEPGQNLVCYQCQPGHELVINQCQSNGLDQLSISTWTLASNYQCLKTDFCHFQAGLGPPLVK